MNFEEFNESMNTILDDLEDLSEKYTIFNESIDAELNVNIEKAKVYVTEQKATDADLLYLITEAEKEASEKKLSATEKFQSAAVVAFNKMTDELSQFADSAKTNFAIDKLSANAELAKKNVSVQVSKAIKFSADVQSDIMVKLSVLKANTAAALSDDEIKKLKAAVEKAKAELRSAKDTVSTSADKAVNMYKQKLMDIKTEVASNKHITESLEAISKEKDKWAKRTAENKKQITELLNSLTSLFAVRVHAFKSDIANISRSIKSAVAGSNNEETKEEPKKESVNVSELLTNIINDKVSSIINESEEEKVEEPDETDKLLAMIESEIEESENSEITDIVLDESVNTDDIVDELLNELL